MDRIKSVIHHGHRKSADATRKEGTSSSPVESNRGPTTEGTQAEGYHPIYDQFSSTSRPNTAGEPIAPKSDNSHVNPAQSQQVDTNVDPADKTLKTPTSSLRPDAAHDRQGLTSAGASAASIKSGVIGFPQGANDQHAAIGRTKNLEDSLDRNQVLGGGGDPSNVTPTKSQENYVARDAGVAAGTAGATGLGAYTAHELNQPNEGAVRKDVPESKTSDSYMPEPSPTTDTDRSFPLVGGVVTRRSVDRAPAQHKNETNEREPGTKDKEVGVKDGEGREGLAHPAATAASSTPAQPTEPLKEDGQLGSKSGYGREGLAGAAALAAATASATRSRPTEPAAEEDVTPRTSRVEQSYHPDALAAATAAATSSSTYPSTHEHHHTTSEQTYQAGQPIRPSCNKRSNTDGTHLHIPGEFPDPTPAEEPAEPSFGNATANVEPSSDAHHELRHTGTLDNPQSKPAEHSPERGLAGVGIIGAGAVGVGAYAAGRHHDNEQPAPEPSPYSATKLDPRVDTHAKTIPSEAEDEKPHRNHFGTGAGAGTATAAGVYGATKAEEKKESTLPVESTTEPQSLAAVDRKDFGDDRKADEHHCARDAAIVGGVGAAGYGLHEANKHHREQPDTHTTAPVTEQPIDTTAPIAEDSTTAPAQLSDDKDHHYGRDAALVGGTSAAGYGVHEGTQNHGELANTQSTSFSEQRYDTTSSGAYDPPKVPTQPGDDMKHHYGRDAAIAGGAGAAGYGLYEASKRRGENSDVQPTSSDAQKYSATAPVNEPSMISGQPSGDTTHHYGRDAVLAGGAGGAGYGVYETAKHYSEHPSTQLAASMDEQRYDPTKASTRTDGDKTHHYGRDAAVTGGVLGTAGAMAYGASRGTDNTQNLDATHQPYTATAPPVDNSYYASGQSSQYPTAQQGAYTQGQAIQDPNQPSQHHYGRDAAVAGGLATTGAGVYAATRNHQDYQQQPAVPQNNYEPAAGHQRYDSVQDPSQSHQKRDVAATSALAAAVGAGGAYAYTQHDADKERLAQRESIEQKAHEQQLKDQSKESAKLQKEREKAFRKEEKEHEKQAAREKKHHDKLVVAEEKKHAKEIEKKEREHEKEVTKAEEKLEKEREKEREKAEREAQKDDKEKKHHLFGFLHRDKDKKERGEQSPQPSPSPRVSKESPRLSKESPPPPAAAMRESPRMSKDYAASPTPASSAQAQAEDPTAINQQPYSQQRETSSPSHSFDNGSGSDTQGLGQSMHSSSPSSHKRRNKLHKDPPKGHPAREALDQHKKDEEIGGFLGNTGDSAYSQSGTGPIDGQNQNYPGAVQYQQQPHAY